jgi:uncharacterized protein YjiS (DUF1127 family)
MLALLSTLLRKHRAATHREMLSLTDLGDHILRDIGLRRTDLYAVPVDRIRPACCSKAACRWAEVVAHLRSLLAPAPVPCCRS